MSIFVRIKVNTLIALLWTITNNIVRVLNGILV